MRCKPIRAATVGVVGCTGIVIGSIALVTPVLLLGSAEWGRLYWVSYGLIASMVGVFWTVVGPTRPMMTPRATSKGAEIMVLALAWPIEGVMRGALELCMILDSVGPDPR